MGFTTSNLSLYHTFSKTPVDSNTSSAAAQLGNAINKSGHTVQSNEIWTESIPFFGLAATTTAIHTKFSATAKVNDLVKDSDGKIWQRNSVEYTAEAKFADLWFEKTTSITSTTKDSDGNYPTAAGALLDGSYLLNSEGVPTVKYYEKRLLTRLTADNNANTNSDNKASRLQIDGKWIDQFIGVTDIYLNGSAAVSYAPVLRKSASASPMQAGPGKGYMDYCATGLILWESSASGSEVIDCFEYVGEKLNATVASLSKAVFGEGGSESNDASLTQKVAQNTAAIAKLNGSSTETGSVAKAVADAEGRVKVTTDALAGRIAQLEGIQHFSVVVCEGTTLPAAPVENTIYLVAEEGVAEGTYIEYIAYKPAGSASVVTEKIGSTAINLDGYTTDAEHEALQGRVSTIETTTVPALQQAITDGVAGAKSEAATNLATARTQITAEIAQAKSEAIASAEVTITAGTGIVVTGEGKGTTFQIAVSDDVATAASVSALSQVVASNKTELEGKITAAQTEIKGTTDALDTRLQTAEGKVSTLEGQVSTLTTGNNSVAKQIETAANAIKGQSLAKTGTLSGMFSVTTSGTVGTGITGITISDTGLSTAIAAAKSGAEQTAATALSTARGEITSEISTAVSGLETKLTTGTGSLGAKVAALETATGTTLPAAIQQALTDAKAYSDSLHTTSLDYVVLGDSEVLPTASADTLGKIYLVASQNAPTADGSAISGSYVEYMTRKVSETEYTWEKIGTTAADLSAYAKTADVTTSIATAKSEAIAAAKTETTTQVNALAATHATDKAALEASIATKVGEVQWFGTNDLLSTKAEVKDGKLVVSEKEIAPIREWAMERNITKVINEVAYAGDTKYCTIETSKMTDGTDMFYHSSLSEFSSDLSSLTDGSNMFWSADNIETFVNDMPSLTDGGGMFEGCNKLKTFIGDLSSLSYGVGMF